MELTGYRNRDLFLQDILPIIEGNFISHYLLALAIDRLIQESEKIYTGCTIQTNHMIDII